MFKGIVAAFVLVLMLVCLIYSQSFAQQKALKFHSVPTAATLIATTGTTTTCTGKISAVTVVGGIITAATCTS
jgi:hypothetical protein